MTSYDFNDFGASSGYGSTPNMGGGGSPSLAYAPSYYGGGGSFQPLQQQQQTPFGFGLSRGSDVNWQQQPLGFGGGGAASSPWQFGGGGGGGYHFGGSSSSSSPGHDPSAGLLRNMWNSSREYWRTGVSQNVKKFIYLFLVLLLIIAVGKVAHFVYRWRFPSKREEGETQTDATAASATATPEHASPQEGGAATPTTTTTPVYDYANAFDYALSPPLQPHLSVMPAHYRHLRPRQLTSHLNVIAPTTPQGEAVTRPDSADRVSVRKFIVESLEMVAVLIQWANEPLDAIQQLSASEAHASQPILKQKRARDAANKQKLWELRQLYLSRALQLLQILQQYIDPVRLQVLYQVDISQYMAQIAQDQNACQDAIQHVQADLAAMASEQLLPAASVTMTSPKQVATKHNNKSSAASNRPSNAPRTHSTAAASSTLPTPARNMYAQPAPSPPSL